MPATSTASRVPDSLGRIKLSEQVLKLKASDKMIREDTAVELAANPDPRVAAELCYLLADPDISVRNLVAEILVKMGSAASGALIGAAASPDHDVRKFAVDIMALIHDPQCVPVLVKLLNDPKENVVGSAAEALGHIPHPDAVQPLIECLETHPDSRLQTIEALGKIGSVQALMPLIDLLDSENVVLAYAAVEAIGKIDSPRAINKLLSMLKVGNPELRNVVLTTVLKKAGSGNREDLFNATGGKYIDYLIEAARSDDHDIKNSVIMELAFWTGDKVVAALIQALEDTDQVIVDTAKGALRIAGNTGLRQVINGVEKGSDTVRQNLIEISSFLKSPELLNAIISQANCDNPDIRMAVAKTLAKYSSQEVIDILLLLANDDVGHVRVEALRALGLTAGETEVEKIARHLDDEYADVREACLGTMVLIGGEKTIRLFEKFITDSDIERKILAVRGLGWIGEDRAIEILIEALNNEEPEVRRYAIIGLAKMNYKGLEDSLTIMIADENPEVRKAVIDAYISILGPEAGGKICVLLDDADMWVRFYAINGLISIEDMTCLDKLLEIMPKQAPFVQIAIINLIAGNDDPKAAVSLQKFAKSDNEDIANAAREALEKRA